MKISGVGFEIDSLPIEEKSTFYRSIYTNPSGWNKNLGKCFESLIDTDYCKGKLERKTYGISKGIKWPAFQFFHFLTSQV